jgi:mRNA-degrading endonuclease toxin of MazEF toxin-antitoxin module
MTVPAPARAEVWHINFDPAVGHEQASTRTNRNIRWHVRVAPPEGGLASESFILCDGARPVSKARLKRAAGG